MRPWIVVAVVVALLGAAAWWLVPSRGATAGGGFKPPPPSVEVGPVETGAVVHSVEAVGTLRANESVTIRPEVAGRITAFHFAEGEPTAAGVRLVSLDDSTYAAEVEEKTADLNLAKLEFKRADELVAKKAAPVEARDRALLHMQATEAALKLAQARLEKTHLMAPFAGIVGLRHVSVGDYVKEGQDLVSLVDLETLKVDFRVGEIYLADVSRGQTIEVIVDAFPGETFTGAVYAIEPQVDINGRAVLIRARLPNDALKLRPGLFSRVDLIVNATAEALLVPEDAIVPRGDQHFVYRLVDNHAMLTEVVVGKRQGARVEIKQGVSQSDVVVTAGQLKLRDGVPVAPVAARTTTTVAGDGSGLATDGSGSTTQPEPAEGT